MRLFCIKLILGFSNYFREKDESVYEYIFWGRNSLILISFIILITILTAFGLDPFVALHGHEKLERMGILSLGYLLVLPLFIVLFPSKDIEKVNLSEKELNIFHKINVIILFSLIILFMLVTLLKKGILAF